ncbi:MAG: hypothetical protein CVT63_00325 [Candidatus Anoxymicrobium japonicum]|uniref:DOD-type homing endonuclease domain-containing protein n=1 Tax=Candidatus Anoxymicrobium japonicum TaxID=2013648 RepID=A0A2N3G8I1_9ACTN|nr:MAG: hypothetical protein CVT63_00325 [Candidatus Anoxymicrobium japonicum]
MTPKIQVLDNNVGFTYEAACDATDIALRVSTVSQEEINLWDKQRIVASIMLEAKASPELAQEIADEVEKALVTSDQIRVTTSLIRELIDLQFMERGLSHMLERHTKLGLPMFDVENIITQANKENSNTTHNPESINLTIAEAVLKQYALEKVFSDDIARAHYEGAIHLHDLGFIVRPYCGGHSLEYVKKYGLRLPNITSTSRPAKHPDVLIGHMVKMASTLQSYYAGAIGWEAVNVFFAPLLVGLPYERLLQLAQMLIFEFNQLAGARGSLRGDERIFVYDSISDKLDLVEIGAFVDSRLAVEGEATSKVEGDRYYAVSFDHETGETVLSRIYAAIRHENNHQVVEVKTGQGQKVKVTDNHSLFMFDEEGQVIGALPKDEPEVVLVPRQIDIDHEQKSVDVLKLVGDFDTLETGGQVFIRGKSPRKFGVDQFLSVTPELARLLGYYVSEGSLGSQVSLHVFHDSLFEDVKKCVETVFGVPCRVKGGTCSFGGRTHVALFEALCGRQAENKMIPTIVLLGKREIVEEFLSAYLSGDGYISGNRIGCSTVSLTLKAHLWFAFTRLGAVPSIRTDQVAPVEIKRNKVAVARERHVVTIGSTQLEKVRFVHSEKEAARVSSIEKPGKQYDQKRYSYEHLRGLIKEVFGDRMSVKKLGKITPEKIRELHSEVERRLACVDIEQLERLCNEDMVALCKRYLTGNPDICYQTAYGLMRQLEKDAVPVHSCHMRPDRILDDSPYAGLQMDRVIDSLSVPRAIEARKGLNDSQFFFDARQIPSNPNMLKLGLGIAIKQHEKMSRLKEALERCLALLPAGVDSIEPIDNKEYVYDIGVEGTENFLTADGIFAHNSQVVFTDFNLYWNVPGHLADAPAIGPGGVPTGKTYKEYEPEAQAFLKALFEIYLKGDAMGKTFVFPKPLLHINNDFFRTEGWEEMLDIACDVAGKQGITYFVFDRGDEVTVSQCCRLKLKLSEEDIKEALTPEKMRFSALQNITINLPRIAYLAHGSDEMLFSEIEKTLELVAQAHLQKQKFVSSLMALGADGPVSLLCMENDGDPYLRIDRLTYLAGLIGLNEMVQHHLGHQLHESEEALRFGLKVVAHMSLICDRLSERFGINIVLEESPAESSGYRLAKLDMKYFPSQTKSVLKGDVETDQFYYTNSVHLATDAPIDYVERVQKQSLFHPLIKAGAIIHVWLGEHEPPAASIRKFVEKVFSDTNAAQVAFSPEFTVCETCAKTTRGLSSECPLCGSKDVYGITRIVGYYSKVSTWNKGKLGELKERNRTALTKGDKDVVESICER